MIHRRQFSIGAAAAALGGFGLARAQGETPIVLGQSAPFTGPAAQLGIQFHQGAKLYLEQYNALPGHRSVQIQPLDDGYEPERCAANTRKLIDDDVFALFGYIGTPTSLAALPLAVNAKLPFIAPFTGAMALREPFQRNVFHLRASYNDETALIVKHLTQLGPVSYTHLTLPTKETLKKVPPKPADLAARMKAAEALYEPICTMASGPTAISFLTAPATSTELRSTVASASGFMPWAASASCTPSRPALP